LFTGIIQTVGTVTLHRPEQGDLRLEVTVTPGFLAGTGLGDSIAVNGCCLTVTRFDTTSFSADVSRETLSLTTLGTWRTGTRVNLEKALRAGDPLGGHYVSGHVDGIASVAALSDDGRSRRVEFAVPAPLARYIAKKGSVTIDGVSLTVNSVSDAGQGGPSARFDVNLVPHTLEVTILGAYTAGTPVNLEVDVIARYLERMMKAP